MNKLRIATAALAISLGMGISSTSFAFMASPEKVPMSDLQAELSDTLESLRDEVAAGETEVAVMVEKIDTFVKYIDGMLDEGVENEDVFLDARDEALALRQSIPGLDKYLADVLVGSKSFVPMGGGGSGGFKKVGSPLGHHHHGGGGGGGGGGGFAVLGLGAVAIAVPLAASDNGGSGLPGLPESPSIID